MAEITAAQVKELRERTGAGMMDCKKGLVECNGDLEKACDYLREKGLAAAAKKEGRIAAEGVVESYIHGEGRIGVLVEINCETDFVARGDEFKQFARDIAMQIAAAKPLYVNIEDVPTDILDHEKEILRAQALNEGKPEKIVDKMVEEVYENIQKEHMYRSPDGFFDSGGILRAFIGALLLRELIDRRRFFPRRRRRPWFF